MIASASLLLANPAADQTPQKGMFIMGQGQNQNMMKKCKMHSNKMAMKSNQMQKKMMKQKMKMNSPFLIKHGLPHLTKMIMPYMNDPAFNLTAEQKQKLAKVRQNTMSAIM